MFQNIVVINTFLYQQGGSPQSKGWFSMECHYI